MNLDKRKRRDIGIGILVGLLLLISIIHISCPRLKRPQPTPKLPPHLAGASVWMYKDIAMGGDPKSIADECAHMGYYSVIVKNGDGGLWGVKVYGRNERILQVSPSIVHTFHARGLRLYVYFTAYFSKNSDVQQLVANARKCLHMGADGIILDDVFVYGANRQKVEFVFKNIYQHIHSCKLCKHKMFGFSTFPHMLMRHELPWRVPLKYCDYFLPQIYWQTFRTNPNEILTYMQGSWDGYVAYRRVKTRCLIIPTVHTTEPKKTSNDLARESEKLDKIMSVIYRYYRSISVFRRGIISDPEKKVLKSWAWKFRQSNMIENPSLIKKFDSQK